ncbi:MAG: thioredoxin family protein [Methanobacteriaceae archaeon]|jgi:thiol:disulfide interchange protein DsbD
MQKSVIIIGIIIVAAIVSYAVLGSQSQENVETQDSGINWYRDLNSAFEEAKETNKTVFVYFYTTWCTACRVFDENTLSDPEVQDKLGKDYISVKIDLDKNPQLASDYKIYSIPTLIFLNPDGSEIKRYMGYIDSESFLSQL